ncbi:hypothetical protein [Lihuaxuella thermophila]|uniref:Uncharacterized protein n=1 Tax=Lihuaxuella thermophila TaxID=1173111 RepID=A0A1H8HR55_9BACL|nr:hypothetical protein [Lihuaxuella thermophila]SEN58554.1 hypothetical protein SAMN05444955_1151 [Lihuaxuella thermophila]
MVNKTEKLIRFLEKNRPSDQNTDLVWHFVIKLVQDEGLTIKDLIAMYYLYTVTKNCGSQGINIISHRDGVTTAGIGSRKYTCDENKLLEHWKKTMDAYILKYLLD